MRSPLHDTLQEAAPRSRRRLFPLLLVAGVLAALIGASLAASIQVNGGTDLEFGQGSVTASACTNAASVALATAVDGTGAVKTSSLTITRVSTTCTSKYVRATLTGGGSVRDQVVWQIPSDLTTCTAVTLSATVGGSDSSSNACSGGTFTIYPQPTATIANAPLIAVLASNVTSIQLETSDNAFTASA